LSTEISWVKFIACFPLFSMTWCLRGDETHPQWNEDFRAHWLKMICLNGFLVIFNGSTGCHRTGVLIQETNVIPLRPTHRVRSNSLWSSF
jgi:hypothetical protein